MPAGYAANGVARAKGVGCVVVTFTVGGQCVISAVAGARSELQETLICITRKSDVTYLTEDCGRSVVLACRLCSRWVCTGHATGVCVVTSRMTGAFLRRCHASSKHAFSVSHSRRVPLQAMQQMDMHAQREWGVWWSHSQWEASA